MICRSAGISRGRCRNVVRYDPGKQRPLCTRQQGEHPSLLPQPNTQYATLMLAKLAAAVDPPRGPLLHDEASWSAFMEWLAEAANVLADAVGRDRSVLRETLARPLVGHDPVQRRLVELALELS